MVIFFYIKCNENLKSTVSVNFYIKGNNYITGCERAHYQNRAYVLYSNRFSNGESK